MNRRQLLISMGAMAAGCGRTERGDDTDGAWADGTAGDSGASSDSGLDSMGLDASGGLEGGSSTGYDPVRHRCAVFDSASVGPIPGAGIFGSVTIRPSPSTFCSAT